jgi:hypothetical protein
MQLLRRAIVAWLLAALAACYAFPVTVAINARAAKCCHRGGHGACCRKSESATGSVWTAASDCAQNCRLPAGLTVHASPLAAPGSAATHAAVRSETLAALPANAAGFTSYYAFLYQRPPPSRF